jgi:hypothetical protein
MWSKDAFSASTTKNFEKTATIQVGYQITVPPEYNELQVSALSDVPSIGDSFEGNPYIFVKSRNYTRLSPIYWMAIVTYEGQLAANGGGGVLVTNPEIRWSNASTVEEIDEDADGKPIATANGERLDGATKEISDLVLDVRRNYREINLPATHKYLESVNSDIFEGFAPGTGRLRAFDAEQVWRTQDNGYWRVSAKIQFRYPYRTTPLKAWYARIRHEGLKIRVTDGEEEKIVHAPDGHKGLVTKPVFLNEDGTLREDTETADWREFKRYTPLPYNALGLLD